MAIADSKVKTVDGYGLMGKITIDGMDQSKFRCPRNLASSSEFESCWRPQLHVVGAIYHGVCECYFIMGPDVAKDANMEATVCSRTLEIAQKALIELYK